jgi:MFS family permease
MATQTTEKIFTREFVLSFFSLFGLSSISNLLLPTLPIYLSRLGSSKVEIGILIGTLFICSMVLKPFIGQALLRISEKYFMVSGALLITLSSISYLLAPPFWPLLIVRVFHGVGVAFFYTASVTLVANVSPSARRGQSIGYFYLSYVISFAVAPLFGMWLFNNFGFTLLFLVCVGLSFGSLFITIKLAERPAVPPEDQSIQALPLFGRGSLPPAIMACMASFVWGGVTTFFPLYALHHRMVNPGLFFTAFATMTILVRVLGGRILDLYSREKVILPCLSAYIIAMIILAFSKTLPMFILVAVIWGLGHALLFPVLTAYALDLAGPSPGPAMGTFTAIDDLGLGLGPVIMGIILSLTSFSTMFLCLALTGVINLLYFTQIVRKRGGRQSANP